MRTGRELELNLIRRRRMLPMRNMMIWVLLLLLSLVVVPKSEGQFVQWCIADEQTPKDVLQMALDFACGNGADCSKIQPNQPCFLPNTVKDHASFAFNSFYQRFKHKDEDSCYFRAAAIVTDLDPSYDSCKYEVLP